jgi:hypothetical protein
VYPHRRRPAGFQHAAGPPTERHLEGLPVRLHARRPGRHRQQAHAFGTGLTHPQHALRAVHQQHGALAEHRLQLDQRRRASDANGQAADQQKR